MVKKESSKWESSEEEPEHIPTPSLQPESEEFEDEEFESTKKASIIAETEVVESSGISDDSKSYVDYSVNDMPEVASDASSCNSQKRQLYKTDLGNLDDHARLGEEKTRDLHVLLQCHKALN